MDTVENADVMTPRELATLLRKSAKTVYKCLERKEFPGVRRVGRGYAIHRPTIMAWLAGGKR